MKRNALALLLIFSLLCGCSAPANETVSTEVPEEPVQEQVETAVETQKEEETPVEEVEEAPKPIKADQLVDGTYEITVDSSASMFRVIHCELTVAEGEMTAAMTMSGQGYGFVFLGSSEEALAAAEEEYIPFTLNEDEKKVFTVPVEALNLETDCAAWSIRKEKWYDRVLIFESAELPEEAYREA